MSREAETPYVRPFDWWGARRWSYNRALIAAGVLAFIAAMLLANVCYFLGPLSEYIVQPQDTMRYRCLMYSLGFWFSVLLPFTIPALLLYLSLFHPDQFKHAEFER